MNRRRTVRKPWWVIEDGYLGKERIWCGNWIDVKYHMVSGVVKTIDQNARVDIKRVVYDIPRNWDFVRIPENR